MDKISICDKADGQGDLKFFGVLKKIKGDKMEAIQIIKLGLELKFKDNLSNITNRDILNMAARYVISYEDGNIRSIYKATLKALNR